ncbi:MAG TPA: DinB family protein [Candidatus Krumholzibacteria bacterium]|nr:DinB family protein [Candidatus Krumholzibacteria bacterium]
MLARPEATEYAPYYGKYIGALPEGDILEILASQNRQTLQLLEQLGEEKGNFSYAPGKWSIKQVIGHLCDTERVFSYRALAFARNDRTPLPSMEQDDYVAASNVQRRTLRSVAAEFGSIRAATLSLFQSVEGDMWLRRGTASDCEFTVRTLPYIIAGHELHHMKVVRERYL